MELNRETRKQLRDALLAAFKPNDLEELLYYDLEKDHHQVFRQGGSYRILIKDTIDAAEREGWVAELIWAMKTARPKLAEVQGLPGPSPMPPKADWSSADATPKPRQNASGDKPKAPPVIWTPPSGWFEPPIPFERIDDWTILTRVDGQEMVLVPEGAFICGEYGLEHNPRRQLYLPSFWIDKTPVTNAAYKRFVDDNQSHLIPFVTAETVRLEYDHFLTNNDDWPVERLMTEIRPYLWDPTLRTFPMGKADHPIVMVSWNDAVSYAKWAGKSLPTEEEWEKAARGKEGIMYPWGDEWQDDHCNSSEANIQHTTHVKQFSPRGDSPYGCRDMSGNVHEFCLNKFEFPQDCSLDGSDVPRTMRGGSYYTDNMFCRASFRSDSHSEDFRTPDFGFRTILRRPT